MFLGKIYKRALNKLEAPEYYPVGEFIYKGIIAERGGEEVCLRLLT